MKKYIFLLTALLSTTFLMAKGITQKGVAYMYDYKSKTKQLIANVELTVADAEPAFSRQDGTFTLIFSSREMGDRIVHSKQPYYQGMKVFNRKEFDSWTIRKDPLRLIMCKKDEFDEVKELYYERGRASVKKLYEQKMASLKKEASDYYQRVQELEEERERVMDNLRNSADAMARLDQSEIDAQMREVLSLYEAGEVDRALELLESMGLEEKWVRSLERKQYHEKEAKAASQDSVLGLNNLRSSIDLYKNSGKWDKVTGSLKLIADKLGTYEDLTAYAKFCLDQNMYQESETYYMKALSLTKDDSDNDEETERRCDILTRLGQIYMSTNKYDKARLGLTEAQGLSRRLMAADSSAYRKTYVSTTKTMASFFYDEKDYKNSETNYREALRHCRLLAGQGVEDVDYMLAAILNGLAGVYKDKKQIALSDSMYNESLIIMRKIAGEKPEEYEAELMVSLQNLGEFYYGIKRYNEAERLYEEALWIGRRITAKNPDAHEVYLFVLLLNMGNLYKTTCQYEKCEKTEKEALALARRLTERNPDAYNSYLAKILLNISNLYGALDEYHEQEHVLLECSAIYRNLAEHNPKVYRPEFAMCQINLARLYCVLGNFSACDSILHKSLAIFEDLAQQAPLVYYPQIVIVNRNIAALCKNMGLYDKGRQAYSRSLELLETLSQHVPSVYDSQKADVIEELGDMEIDGDNYPEAERLYLKSWGIYQKLIAQDSATYLGQGASVLLRLGNLYRIRHDFQKSKDLIQQALDIRRQQYNENPIVFSVDYCAALSNLGSLYFEQREYEESEKTYMEIVGIYRKLASNNPSVYNSALAGIENRLADVYREQERYEESKSMGEEALGIIRKLKEKEPGAYDSSLFSELTTLGLLYKENKEYEKSKETFREAYEIIDRLNNKYPQVWGSAFSGTILNLGALYVETKQYSQAEELLNKALDDFIGFSKNTPEVHIQAIAMLYGVLGRIYEECENYDKAANLYGQALEFYGSLSESDRKLYVVEEITMLSLLGKAYCQLGNDSVAESRFKEALELCDGMGIARNDYPWKAAYISHKKLGELNWKKEHAEESIKEYERALDVLERFAVPDSVKEEKAVVYFSLGELYKYIQKEDSCMACFTKSLELYKSLASDDSGYLENYTDAIFNMAILYEEKKDYANSVLSYNQTLGLIKEMEDKQMGEYKAGISNIYRSLGNDYLHLNDTINSISSYKESSRRYWELAENDPVTYLEDAVNASWCIADLYKLTKQYDLAEEQYLKTVNQTMRVNESQQEKNDLIVAQQLFSIAHYYQDLGKQEECISRYKDAVSLYKRLSEKDPANNISRLAEAYYNLAEAQNSMKKYEEAAESYTLMLSLVNEMERPKSHNAIVAEVNFTLGVIYDELKTYEKSAEHYRTASGLYKELAKENPEEYSFNFGNSLYMLAKAYEKLNKPEECAEAYNENLVVTQSLLEAGKCSTASLADVCFSLGTVNRVLKRYEEAERHFLQAIALYKKLTEENLGDYRQYYMNSLYNLAILYEIDGQHEKSIGMYQQTLAEMELSEKEHPLAFNADMAHIYESLGDHYEQLGKHEDAVKVYGMAIDRYKDIEGEKEKERIFATGNCSFKMARIYEHMEKLEKSKEAYQQALEMLEELEKIDPGKHKQDIAETSFSLGRICLEMENDEKAELYYVRARDLYEELYEQHQEKYLLRVASSWYNLALVYDEKGRFPDNEEAFLQALRYTELLAEANPGKLDKDIVNIKVCLGNVKGKHNNLKEGEIYYREALEICEKINADSPSDENNWIMADIMYRLGYVCHEMKKYETAIATYQKSIEIMDALLPSYPQIKNTFARILSSLSFSEILSRRFADAEKHARRGVELDSTQLWIQGNLAASLLFQGKYDEAIQLFAMYKDVLKASMLEDLQVYADEKVIPSQHEKEVENIKKLLNE